MSIHLKIARSLPVRPRRGTIARRIVSVASQGERPAGVRQRSLAGRRLPQNRRLLNLIPKALLADSRRGFLDWQSSDSIGAGDSRHANSGEIERRPFGRSASRPCASANEVIVLRGNQHNHSLYLSSG